MSASNANNADDTLPAPSPLDPDYDMDSSSSNPDDDLFPTTTTSQFPLDPRSLTPPNGPDINGSTWNTGTTGTSKKRTRADNSNSSYKEKESEREREVKPGEGWKNKRAQEEMQRAWESVVDRDFSLKEYGDVMGTQTQQQP